jgi:hypothetical protein
MSCSCRSDPDLGLGSNLVDMCSSGLDSRNLLTAPYRCLSTAGRGRLCFMSNIDSLLCCSCN